MQPDPASPYYRVAAKALIFDDAGRLLILQNYDDECELPGGGWEHDESYLDCLKREIHEELSLEVREVSDIQFIYRGYNARRNFMAMRIVSRAELKPGEIVLGEDMKDYQFVDKQQFQQIDFTPAEGNIQDYIAQIWSES